MRVLYTDPREQVAGGVVQWEESREGPPRGEGEREREGAVGDHVVRWVIRGNN